MLHHPGEFHAHPSGVGLGFQPPAERAGADHHQQASRAPAERGRRLDERGEVLLRGEASDIEDAAAPARASIPRGEPGEVHPVGNEMNTLRRRDGRHVGAQFLRRHDDGGGQPQPDALQDTLGQPGRPGAREARIPEPVGRHEGLAPAGAGREGGDDARELEHPEDRAAAELTAMPHRHLQGSQEPGPAPAGSDEADGASELGILREVAERFGQIAEVPRALEGARVGPEVSLDQSGRLAGLAKLAEPAPEGGQEPEFHHARSAQAPSAPVTRGSRTYA